MAALGTDARTVQLNFFNMNVDEFSKHIEAWRLGVAALLHRVDSEPSSQQELPTAAFFELKAALEELARAGLELRQQNEELCQQNEELESAHKLVEAERQTAAAERQRYQELFEFAPDGYLVTDTEGMIQSANRAACALLNVAQKFLIGKSLCTFVAEQERLAFHSKLTQPRKGDWVRDWEVRLSLPHRRFVDVALTVAAVRDRSGKQVALRWLLRDITDRKRAESALRESNERFRLLMENVKDYAIFTLDPNGYITSWNLGAERILGYQSTEIIGHHGSCFFTPEDRTEGEEHKELRTAVVEGRAEDERWHVRKDGTRFWASGVVTALQDEAGNLRGFSKIVRDMTERKQAEAALQQLNANLESQVQERTAQLQQALKFEAMVKRITGKVRDSLDEGQILQTAVQELALVLGLSGCNAALYNFNQGTSTIYYEYVTSIPASQGRATQMADFPEIYHQLLQGQYFQYCSIVPIPDWDPVMMLACPIANDEGVLGDLWLINQKDYAFNDLEIRLVQQVADQCAIAIRQARLYQAATEQVEELEKLNQLKDDFLSTVSHELRTPIANMKMAIQMLKISPNAERSERYLEILQAECARESDLINDLLDLQRLEAASYPILLREAVSLQDCLPRMIEPFRVRSQQRKQTLKINLPPDLPPLVSDRASLERMLAELLNNACKYTPAGGEIILSVRQEEAIIFTISNCAEIPAAQLPRIFEKFYRVPNADRWKQGGTGLGLALVQKLVELLQGTIKVESSRGWTTFTVELPKSSQESGVRSQNDSF